MSTDAAWEEWGRRDPYFAVLTDPKFRRSGMDEAARREFFASGDAHVQHVLAAICTHVDPQFLPRRVLEFGCGVGRLLPAFAATAAEVVGTDVSPSMLEEARRNCDERSLQNVRLLPTDDQLSALTGSFDLIHSCLVLQHIPVERGREIFARLLGFLRPGGVGAIHLTYSKTHYAATHGSRLRRYGARLRRWLRRRAADADPEIQMNPYNLNELLFLMQRQGVQRFFVEFTDHGGELGVFMFFAMSGLPSEATPPAAEVVPPA